ncbi:hypothetical protein [Spirosoma litoris]
MKRFLIASLSLLLAVSAAHPVQAQSDTIRLYRTTDQVISDNLGGTMPVVHALSDVKVKASGSAVRVYIDGTSTKYSLKGFLNKAGTPYDTVSTVAAVRAYIAKLPGAVGSVATTINDYTSGTNTVATTGVFKIVVRNTGASSATVTYGGFTYAIAAGGVETFEQERDPKSGQRTPFLPLVAIPASSTLRVIKYNEQ